MAEGLRLCLTNQRRRAAPWREKKGTPSPQNRGLLPLWRSQQICKPFKINRNGVEEKLHAWPWLPMRAKTILIVDRDLGFVFWLGQILDAAGYVAVPARGAVEAAEIVATLRLSVDVVIAPLTDRGVNGLVKTLRFASPGIQVIALGGEGDSSVPGRYSETVWQGPCRRDEAAKSEWLGLLYGLDRSYATSASRA